MLLVKHLYDLVYVSMLLRFMDRVGYILRDQYLFQWTKKEEEDFLTKHETLETRANTIFQQPLLGSHYGVEETFSLIARAICIFSLSCFKMMHIPTLPIVDLFN